MSIQLVKRRKYQSSSCGHTLTRTAIDSLGHVGSLYNAQEDRVLENINNTSNATNSNTEQLEVLGEIKRPFDVQPQYFLDLLGIDEQLKLSILLQLTSNHGIASIIDHLHLTNEYTRLFCYSSVRRIETIDVYTTQSNSSMPIKEYPISATHMITGVKWGISIIVLLQLPNDDNTAEEIDKTLDYLLKNLLDDGVDFNLTLQNEKYLEEITSMKIYTNNPGFDGKRSIYEICRFIKDNGKTIEDCPINYELQSIDEFNPVADDIIVDLEDYVLNLTVHIRSLQTKVDKDLSNLSIEYLDEQAILIRNRLNEIQQKFDDEIRRLSKLVVDIRSGHTDPAMKAKLLQPDVQRILKQSIDKLNQDLDIFRTKKDLIYELSSKHISYINATDYNIDSKDNECSIRTKLTKDTSNYRVICSNDRLNRTNKHELQRIISKLCSEFEKHRQLCLFYADFTDCSFELKGILILPTSYDIAQNNNDHLVDSSNRTLFLTSVDSNNYKKPLQNTDYIEPMTQGLTFHSINNESNYLIELPINADGSSIRPKNYDYFISNSAETIKQTQEKINILLLGETGVGKSTFINALANYLKFDSLEKAEKGKLSVIIPVSFVLTTGYDFQEHIVKFFDVENSSNEDFDHSGQSVTQQCQSYEFELDNSIGKTLCLIDTPGFGDTRGLDQDDLNMKHIFDYIKNFTHLNAICFLLKPNLSRLNVYYRTCFSQLCSVFNPNTPNNVIFCFTNSRSTFYTPGDTAPLLKNMLKSLPRNDIPFKKNNTFCFDSESFRYLLALQNGIEFDHDQRSEYEISWKSSALAACCLIHYVSDELTKFPTS